jgi:lysophospholipase L1-like esterase
METQWDYFSIKSKTLRKNSDQFVFLGDSLITVLCVENLFNGINLGIAAESVQRAKQKVLGIANLENKNIVLAYGINDILCKSTTVYNDYIELINHLPESAIIYIFSVLPVDEEAAKGCIKSVTNQQIKELNKALQQYAGSSARVRFLDLGKGLYDANGQLNRTLHKGDGIHLNEEGNLLWIRAIKEEISKFENHPMFK